jgi:hypothetical protein
VNGFSRLKRDFGCDVGEFNGETYEILDGLRQYYRSQKILLKEEFFNLIHSVYHKFFSEPNVQQFDNLKKLTNKMYIALYEFEKRHKCSRLPADPFNFSNWAFAITTEFEAQK